MRDARARTTHRRRLLVALSALVAAAAGGVATAPSASAAPQVRYFTAVLAPETVSPGASTVLTLTVQNTSTAISALDRVRLTIPAGFTVTGPFVVSRAGWTASLTDPTTLTAKTSTPLRSGLLRGQSLTIKLTATTPSVGFCPSEPVPWPVRADGVLLPFVLQGAAPAVAVTSSETCKNVGLEPGQVATLGIPGASAFLGHGASGTVALYSEVCVDACIGSLVTLTGNFKANGQPLYGFGEGQEPATMTLTCAAVDCPSSQVPTPEETEGHCHESQLTCPGYDPGSDFATYLVKVAVEGSQAGYVQAGACVGGVPADNSPFCVDVAHMSRDTISGNPALCFGDLHIPVLFADDPKFIITR